MSIAIYHHMIHYYMPRYLELNILVLDSIHDSIHFHKTISYKTSSNQQSSTTVFSRYVFIFKYLFRVSIILSHICCYLLFEERNCLENLQFHQEEEEACLQHCTHSFFSTFSWMPPPTLLSLNSTMENVIAKKMRSRYYMKSVSWEKHHSYAWRRRSASTL